MDDRRLTILHSPLSMVYGQKVGESGWESNPPRPATRPATGFEDQEAHRDLTTPICKDNRTEKGLQGRLSVSIKVADFACLVEQNLRGMERARCLWRQDTASQLPSALRPRLKTMQKAVRSFRLNEVRARQSRPAQARQCPTPSLVDNKSGRLTGWARDQYTKRVLQG